MLVDKPFPCIDQEPSQKPGLGRACWWPGLEKPGKPGQGLAFTATMATTAWLSHIVSK